MDIVRELIKFVLPLIALLLIPALFVLVFDIGAHLGQIFGRR